LLEAIGQVLKGHRVAGLLRLAYVKQSVCETTYVGRGRGGAKRQQQVIEKVRYQITEVRRDDERVANLKAGLEWKAFVTNATAKRLSLAEAVWGYRHEYRIERIFSRLKSRLQIAPMYVKREDQIEGLTYLLTLGVRAVSQHVSSQVCGVGNDIRTPARITAVQYRPGLIHGVVPQQRALAGARRSQEHVR
jgi:transposase